MLQRRKKADQKMLLKRDWYKSELSKPQTLDLQGGGEKVAFSAKVEGISFR